MQQIVTIGGGTGHFQILKGLKNYECNIMAIANMADDCESSGKLRTSMIYCHLEMQDNVLLRLLKKMEVKKIV